MFSSFVGVGAIGVMLGSACLLFQRKSLFGILLSLEIFTLGVYVMIFHVFGGLAGICLVFLTFGVCEAAMGLGVLVSLMRSFGGDYVSGLSCGHF